MTDQQQYPHQDGDVTVLGPRVFVSNDGVVINWRGVNYVPQPDEQSTEATTPAESPLRDLIAAAIYERNNPGHPWAEAHPDDRVCYSSDADAALAVIRPGARITAGLARAADADVQRVIALYERWRAVGPPPLGTSTARWWDARLAELHNAILPPADQTQEQ
ncbi:MULTISPECIES: hypothetical protein [Streptomyces]|uniref:hypothetical protein n=1 Tax=Streptomyces TaxID=1883 RepID=UPI0016794F6A|nr:MULTISPECIES: hypothetical protein [Streptomyces]MBK3524852.1 hypothetical protein [Streptomyces sp. MBT70]GGR70921.1 hypothetical protein GCM10010236_26470 [Streptomyces eurythermus]